MNNIKNIEPKRLPRKLKKLMWRIAYRKLSAAVPKHIPKRLRFRPTELHGVRIVSNYTHGEHPQSLGTFGKYSVVAYKLG